MTSGVWNPLVWYQLQSSDSETHWYLCKHALFWTTGVLCVELASILILTCFKEQIKFLIQSFLHSWCPLVSRGLSPSAPNQGHWSLRFFTPYRSFWYSQHLLKTQSNCINSWVDEDWKNDQNYPHLETLSVQKKLAQRLLVGLTFRGLFMKKSDSESCYGCTFCKFL